MYQLMLVVHSLIAISLIGLLLIQQGKGAEIGASFGAGASNTIFGSQGAGGFMFKLTGSLALLFFASSLMLSYKVSVDARQAKMMAIPHIQKAKDTVLPLPSGMPVPQNKNK